MKKKEVKTKKRANRIRYLIQKGNSLYWQPSTRLRALGWEPVKLSDNIREARNEADELNDKLDAWRFGDLEETNRQEKKVSRTLDNLIDSYMEDIKYLKKKPNTKTSYQRHIKTIRRWGGKTPVDAITPATVNILYNSISKKYSLHKANAVISVLRLILAFGVRPLGWLSENPAADPGMVNTPARERFCSYEEQEVFIRTADRMGLPSIGSTFLCGLYIGQREADILKINAFMYKDGSFNIKQNKTSRWISVPAAKPLLERFEKTGVQEGSHLIVTETKKIPYSCSYFRHKFSEVRAEAAKELPSIADLQFLDLRRTAVVRMGNAGCTEYQIAAVTGHRIDTCRKILETYLPRTGKMAADAIKKIEMEEAA